MISLTMEGQNDNIKHYYGKDKYSPEWPELPEFPTCSLGN